MPAVTIVAACMRAETGVGPAMASGSHTWNGNWALLPIAPMNSARPAQNPNWARVELPPTMVSKISENLNDPADSAMMIAPMNRPVSATLFTMNALLPASTLSKSSQ